MNVNATAITCFSRTAAKYPYIIGGSTSDTILYAMDMDSSSNYVVGGKSSDTGLVTPTQTGYYMPIVIFV